MSGVPYTFASATSSIPLSQLDANFATNATLGNATVGLGNTTTTVGNLTVSNVTINGLSGGVANGVVYINTSNVATANASALSFTGTNLGIGTSSPSYKLQVYGQSYFSASTAYTYISDGGSSDSGNFAIWGNGSNYSVSIGQAKPGSGGSVTNDMIFSTNSGGSWSERMRLDNSGNFNVGFTGGSGLNVFYNNTDCVNTRTGQAAGNSRSLYTGYYSATSSTAGTLCFNVTSNGNVLNTNNSYGPLSDVKLKENIVDATPKLADILKLQVRNYNLKSELGYQSHKQIGFIAQELETVFPALIDEHPDRDEEGKDLGTTTKSIKTSVLVPMLVKAIQELSAQVTTLQSQVAALQAKVGA